MRALTYLPYLILRTAISAISAISATSCARGRGRERGHPYKHVYRHPPLTLTLYHSSVIGICPGFSIHWIQLSLKLTALFTNNNLSECVLLPTYPTALIIGEVTGLQHSPTSLRLIPIIIPFFWPNQKKLKQTQFGMKSFMHKSNSKQSFCFPIVNAEFWEGGYSGHCYWNVIVVNWLNFDLILSLTFHLFI